MELVQLIEALSRPEAYPDAVAEVEVVQTHISAVFLVGEHAYKIKKPVDLGFLDFRTLEQRHHFCEEEVRLNRRGAPDVYLAVVPVIREDGGVRVVAGAGEAEAQGEIVEYAVHMRRLPEDRTLGALLDRGQLDAALVGRLARRIAAFHARAESGVHLAAHGGWDTVAFNVRENFEQLEPFIGHTISRPVFDRLLALTEDGLATLRPLIDGRADRGVTCDTHGDLHLAHIYSFPDRPPPGDFLLVDCIEFNARFRYADPVADLAFLAMDLTFHARRDLTRCLVDAYLDAAGDAEGRELLAFYTAYRAVVRGKVGSFALLATEIPAADRERILARTRPLLLLALGELAPPSERPCLVMTAGLPGTGKSRLARGLERQAGFTRVATDIVRKGLAGVSPGQEAEVRLAAACYSAEWSEQTYEASLAQAEALLFEGRRVVVDGTFRQDRWRHRFLELADRWSVPGLVFVCEADPEAVRQRLANRPPDVSDAGWDVYELLSSQWEPPTGESLARTRRLDTMAAPESTLADALAHLAAAGSA